MTKIQASLEQAIINQAMREPAFMAKLLQDPMGFLKGLAASRPLAGTSLMTSWMRRLRLQQQGGLLRFASRTLKHSH